MKQSIRKFFKIFKIRGSEKRISYYFLTPQSESAILPDLLPTYGGYPLPLQYSPARLLF